MLPVLHPLCKTAIDARRGIDRLEHFIKLSPEDEYVVSGVVEEIINDLKSIRQHIPAPLRDVDLNS